MNKKIHKATLNYRIQKRKDEITIKNTLFFFFSRLHKKRRKMNDWEKDQI